MPPWGNRDGLLSQCGPLVKYHPYHFRTHPFSEENAIGNRMIKDQQRELTIRLAHTRSSLAEIRNREKLRSFLKSVASEF